MCKLTTGKGISRRTDSNPGVLEFARKDGRSSLGAVQSTRGMPEMEAYLMS